MEQLPAERVSFIFQAAMASLIAGNEGAVLIRDGDSNAPSNQDFYTVVPGYFRTLGSTFMGLEAMSNQAQRIVDTGEGDPDRPMQWGDTVLQLSYAQLQEDILNPNLPFTYSVPSSDEMETIGAVYETSLRTATFAGGVASADVRVSAARELLFDEEDDGTTNRSAVYERYLDFERDLQEVQDRLSQGLSDDARNRLEDRASRIEVEWLEIGHRREIEEAIEVIQKGDSDSGFEGQRIDFLHRLDAGRRDWPGQETDYFESYLSPAEPLFSDQSDIGVWRSAVVTAIELTEILDVASRAAADISLQEIELASGLSIEISMDYIVCGISRKWLDTSFFDANYWKGPSDAEELSNGAGEGKLACLSKRVVFGRNFRYIQRSPAANDVLSAADPAPPVLMMPTMTMMQPLAGEAPPPTADEPKLLAAAEDQGLLVSARLLQASPLLFSQPMTLASVDIEPKVRDHRKKQLKPQVRDHRTRKSRTKRFNAASAAQFARVTHVVQAVRGRDPKSVKTVKVSGSIVADEADRDILKGLVVSFQATEPDMGPETALDLVQDRDDHLKFEATLRANASGPSGVPSPRPIEQYEIVLRDRNSAELIRHSVDMTNESESIEIEWHVQNEIIHEQVPEVPEAPFLHGYVVKLVPACPRPDDSFDWQ